MLSWSPSGLSVEAAYEEKPLAHLAPPNVFPLVRCPRRFQIAKQKHSIDNSAPKPYMHLHVKLKKLQTEEERLAVIERDNRMLLEKMSRIMRTQGQVDHRNYYEHKSLNYEQRHKQMLRITRENQAILERIQKRKPIINAAAMDEEYAQSAVYGENLSRYPKLEPIRLETQPYEETLAPTAEGVPAAAAEPELEPEPATAAPEPEPEAEAEAEAEAYAAPEAAAAEPEAAAAEPEAAAEETA